MNLYELMAMLKKCMRNMEQFEAQLIYLNGKDYHDFVRIVRMICTELELNDINKYPQNYINLYGDILKISPYPEEKARITICQK